MKKINICILLSIILLIVACSSKKSTNLLVDGFVNPPDSAKPGVYWYFMDGNLSKEGMTKDLESMKKAGIGNLIFLEVNVGIPRGPVDFLSNQWQELFKHAVRECERLDISMTLGIGPGWTGSGGPWVTPEQSMQHLVSSSIQVSGNQKMKIKLPLPAPKRPFFGEGTLTPDLKKQWNDFYEDVAVLAFPTQTRVQKIEDIEEKALYYRAPYTSQSGVKPFLPSFASYNDLPKGVSISKNQILDLSTKLLSDGTLNWEIPAGNWTIMRFGKRNNGAVTRPAPLPGLGFESDKFDTIALNAHLDHYVGTLLRKIGEPNKKLAGGLKMLHMDSWEMGAQNWTSKFREEFEKRRGYDPLPFYPVYAGNIVENIEISERFLWDLRLTSQELVLENHANQVKKYSKRHGLGLSIEPYDMNPTADLELGAVADVPMCEFWSKDLGFNSTFSCIEATSIAHINGQALVPAEAFTAEGAEARKQNPSSMKEQGDWAFATGINRFVYHTFQHQFLDDKFLPGATMGPYGVHWDRGQTWWPMVGDYHQYVSRCQFILQQGKIVADLLYLTPEGAPHIFRPPSSALTAEDAFLPDRKGYNFDGCAPSQLLKATVKDNRIVFPSGASYRLLILPAVETMTPSLLEKIKSLIFQGAIVVGNPPIKSPSLSNFPQCDVEVKNKATEIWGQLAISSTLSTRNYGKGKIISGGQLYLKNELYPHYDTTAEIVKNNAVTEDFKSTTPIRYTHRSLEDKEIYFVSNKLNKESKAVCVFRATGSPELWNPLTGEIRKLSQFSTTGQTTTIALELDAFQSFFVVFKKGNKKRLETKNNFPSKTPVTTLKGSWEVSFDPKFGGPKKVTFPTLIDWTTSNEAGIKYYSGIAVYQKQFDFDTTKTTKDQEVYLDLGEVNTMARVKLNGHDLGVVWTSPWKVNITKFVKQKDNFLEIEVANLWANRLIGDEYLPVDGIKNDQWPEWLLKGQKRTSGRVTFTTYRHYTKDSPLLKSGLIGPVTIHKESFK